MNFETNRVCLFRFDLKIDKLLQFSVPEDGKVHLLGKHRVARAKIEAPPVHPRGIKPTPKKRVVRAKTERPPVGPRGIRPSPKKRIVRAIIDSSLGS